MLETQYMLQLKGLIVLMLLVQCNTDIFAQPGSAVHLDCRKRYIDKKDIKSNKRKSSITATEEQALLSSSRRPRLRTEERHQICIFCSQHVDFETSKYGEEIDASRVQFHEFTTSILACCDLRRDEWAFTVEGKIEFYNEDLPAAYWRALRGHLIIDQALSKLIIEKLNDDSFISELEPIYNDATEGKKETSEIEDNNVLHEISSRIEEAKKTLANESRTSKLWMGYLRIIDIITKYIRADRLGIWDLHLETIQESLPIFAAAGHFNYVKSSYLYLQTMLDFAAKNSKVFQYFKSGGFVVRRSERHWAGLACDLTIEQVLLRSLKTTGGLTRGTGLSDVQRSIWLLSKPVCSKYSLQMEDNIGILHSASEQHKSIGKTRLKRDIEDTGKIMDRLQNVSPFDGVQSLMNTVNGVVADKYSNVDDFYSIGTSIINKMSGQKVFDYTFKRKDAAKTMSSKTKIGRNNKIDIDPALLFQRLLVVANASTVSPNDVFSYELCSYPPAIFETPILLRKVKNRRSNKKSYQAAGETE